MSCHIRKAVLSDALLACKVVRDSIEKLCVDDHRGDAATLTDWLENKTPENFERWIQSDQHLAVAAELDERVVGFGLLNVNGYIALLYVAPEARFRGVSKALLGALEKEAMLAGIGELEVVSSATALQFYRATGYSPTGDRVQGFGVTSGYPMSRELGDV